MFGLLALKRIISFYLMDKKAIKIRSGQQKINISQHKTYVVGTEKNHVNERVCLGIQNI